MSSVVAVAVSGGRDSMALLHCTARAAATRGLQVVALHVNHGLMPAADEWEAFVAAACRRWSKRWPVRSLSHRLEGRPRRGESVEAWARTGRYRALAELARSAGADLVLLAHHRGDQAETFLLQALRGAGPAGLASMPRLAVRNGIAWARPWLDLPREAVEAYGRRHRIGFIDDPSNLDPRFSRSRLRDEVMPALRRAFAQADAALAGAARQAALARHLAESVALADLGTITDGHALDLLAWASLDVARQRNALGAWLSQQQAAVGVQMLDRLMNELATSAQPASWSWDRHVLRRYRGRLRLETADMPQMPSVHLRVVEEGGVPCAALLGAQWQTRRGGETFQRGPRTPPRSLKKQFQAAGVPAWARAAPLLVDAEGRLLFVPGLGLDARAVRRAGAPRVVIEWDTRDSDGPAA
jgi:tRNA(Ile)-lysidine synthase